MFTYRTKMIHIHFIYLISRDIHLKFTESAALSTTRYSISTSVTHDIDWVYFFQFFSFAFWHRRVFRINHRLFWNIPVGIQYWNIDLEKSHIRWFALFIMRCSWWEIFFSEYTETQRSKPNSVEIIDPLYSVLRPSVLKRGLNYKIKPIF